MAYFDRPETWNYHHFPSFHLYLVSSMQLVTSDSCTVRRNSVNFMLFILKCVCVNIFVCSHEGTSDPTLWRVTKPTTISHQTPAINTHTNYSLVIWKGRSYQRKHTLELQNIMETGRKNQSNSVITKVCKKTHFQFLFTSKGYLHWTKHQSEILK